MLGLARLNKSLFMLFWSLVTIPASADLFLNVESLDKANGKVVVNGVFNKPSRMGVYFDWGDGTYSQGFFPQVHTYSDKSRNYTVRGYVTYDDATYNHATTTVFFFRQNYNIRGAHVSFQGFPDDYFMNANPPVSPEELVRLVDIQFEILRTAHTSYDGTPIVFSYSPSCGGAYSVARTHTIYMCDGFKVANISGSVIPWAVMAHEMSHNMFGNADTFLFSFMFMYSAYLDEHQAEVMPEYVLRTMQNNRIQYNLSEAQIQSMRQGFNLVDYSSHYQRYLAGGKFFQILQSLPAEATLTGQATSHVVLEIYKQAKNDLSILRYFTHYLENQYTTRAFSKAGPSTTELGNYVLAAWSAAAGRDLRPEFKNLNYPVSDSLFNRYMNIFSKNRIASTKGDFTGDGRADLAIFRPGEGNWYISGSAVRQWGLPGDIPVAADYDGDFKPDYAVYRPTTGTWWILESNTNYSTSSSVKLGQEQDIPTPGDFNGDGRVDIAMWRPSTGVWSIVGMGEFQWGEFGDRPVPADMNGDGKTDLVVFRPSTGTWWIKDASSGYTNYQTIPFGQAGDIPIPADYDGDGKSEIAVYRPASGMWYVKGLLAQQWGLNGDIPIPRDFDGDGKIDLTVYRPSNATWYILNSTTNYIEQTVQQWGFSTDLPAASE